MLFRSATPHQYQANAQAARFPGTGTATPTDAAHHNNSISPTTQRKPGHPSRGGSLTSKPVGLDPPPQPSGAEVSVLPSAVHDFGSLSSEPKIFPGVLENRERRRRSSVARSGEFNGLEDMARSQELRRRASVEAGIESEGDE